MIAKRLIGRMIRQAPAEWIASRSMLRRGFASRGDGLIEFCFMNKDGSLTEVKAQKGMSLLEVAHQFGVDLEGACEASLACR
jgi:hypothetical protein